MPGMNGAVAVLCTTLYGVATLKLSRLFSTPRLAMWRQIQVRHATHELRHKAVEASLDRGNSYYRLRGIDGDTQMNPVQANISEATISTSDQYTWQHMKQGQT